MAYNTTTNNLVVIFNIQKERPGSQHDVRNIINVFSQLNFDIEEWIDLKTNEFEDKINYLKSKNSEKRYKSLIVFAMAHGEDNSLILEDGTKCPVVTFEEKFSVHFKYIPKIFFIQACREITHDNNDAFQTRSDAVPCSSSRENLDVQDNNFINVNVKENLITIFPTQNGISIFYIY